jgi:hypothetical protein
MNSEDLHNGHVYARPYEDPIAPVGGDKIDTARRIETLGLPHKRQDGKGPAII